MLGWSMSSHVELNRCAPPLPDLVTYSAHRALYRRKPVRSASVLQPPEAHGSTGLARLIERRATEAVIWGMPIVGFDAMRQAFFRDAAAAYGDILYWSKPADWKLQFAIPDTLSCNVYFNFNTRQGPVVVDLPPSNGAALAGSLVNAWETSLVEIGPVGSDRGRGCKLLLLPPGYKGLVPSGYIPIRSETYNGRALLSATTPARSMDTAVALSLVQKIRTYPLAQAFAHTSQRFIDMSGRLFDAVVRFDDSFFDSLARMVCEEPVQTRDLVAMSQIYSLGIDKDRAFKPDGTTRELLRQAAADVHAALGSTANGGERLSPTTHWIRSAVARSRTSFTYETATRFGIDERNVRFFMAFDTPQKPQTAPPYLCAFCDADGERLSGERLYKLRIPAGVPARQGWELSAYDSATACFIREAPSVAIDSHLAETSKNPDGSVDVYFGPIRPSGVEGRWIYTEPGKAWFALFRLHQPERAFFEKTWLLPNLESLG